METVSLGQGRRIAAHVAAVLPALVLLAAPAIAAAELINGDLPATGYTWTVFLDTLSKTAVLMVKLAVMIGAAALMYAGYEYATAGGDPGKVAKAHKTFKSVLIGIGLAVAAYAIVATIIKALGGAPLLQAWINPK